MTSSDDAPGAAPTPPSGRQWVIRSGRHEATVVEVGGGLRRYTVDGADVLDGYPVDELPKGCRGQVLAPFANRIEDGRYTFDGVEHQLDISEVPTNTAFHGLVRWQGWEPVLVEPDSVVLTTPVHARDGYPFTLRLGVKYTVSADGLTVEHTATNTGSARAPFMMATHCYPTVPGVPVDRLRVTVPAATFLPTTDRLLPLPATPVEGTDHDLRNGELFGDRVVDNAYGDLTRDPDGLVRVHVADDDGRGFVVWADDSFGWLQVYSSDTQTEERFRRSFAVEPMTGPPDNFRSGVDLVVLSPGRTWRGVWGLQPVPGAPGWDPDAGTAAVDTGDGESDVQAATPPGTALGSTGTVQGPPVTGTAADLLPDVTTDEAEIRRVDPSLAGAAAGDDDERILREVPPHHLG